MSPAEPLDVLQRVLIELRQAAATVGADAVPVFEAARQMIGEAGEPPAAKPAGDDGPGADGPGAERVGTGPRESTHEGGVCRSCPLCRLLAAVQQVRPEALDHLRLSMDHLVAAVSMLTQADAAATDLVTRDRAAPEASTPEAERGQGSGPSGSPGTGAPQQPWPATAAVHPEPDRNEHIPLQWIEVE